MNRDREDKPGLLDQGHPRMVIRQIYNLASATTTTYMAFTITLAACN